MKEEHTHDNEVGTYIAIAIKPRQVDVLTIKSPLRDRVIGIGGTQYTQARIDFCLIDAICGDRGIVAFRVFLLGDLRVPAYFKNVKHIEVDSDTSFFIWLDDSKVPINDETYIRVQDLGERLYESSNGEWLMLFGAGLFLDLGFDRKLPRFS